MQAEILIKLLVNFQGGTFTARRGEVIALPRIQAQSMINQRHAEELSHPAAAGLTCVKTLIGHVGPGRSFGIGQRLFLPREEAQSLIHLGHAEKESWRN